MRRVIIALLAATLFLALGACGETKAEPTPTPAPVETAAPAPELTATPAPTEDPAAALKATAEKYVDKPLSELIEAIGEPESSEYASSCLGPGEDGNLYYDGFVVYTYRENGAESVYAVR